MRRIYVRLAPEQIDKLVELAELAHRHPSDQAARMLAPAIQKASTQRVRKQPTAAAVTA